jgi:hypothetical protein
MRTCRIGARRGSLLRIDTKLFCFDEPPRGRAMFATLKSLIPEPRQADQPRHYIGRHRRPEPVPVPVSPTAVSSAPVTEASDTAEAQPAA